LTKKVACLPSIFVGLAAGQVKNFAKDVAMINWEKKARLLAGMVEAKRPIKEIRAMARGILELMEKDQEAREMFWAWNRCRGTSEERDEANYIYICAIRRANFASEQLDKLGGE
jgi:hypothetical protein